MSAEEYYFKFNIKNKQELRNLTKIISISNVKDNQVTAYANDDQLLAFKILGYEYEILTPPGKRINPTMSQSIEGLADWDTYPTYEQYETMMFDFASNYPDLCQIYDVGTTVQGRKILFAKISDNVTANENEPEVMFTSTMHGDETTGYILMLRLIDYLLTSYATDSDIAYLVNNMEIWINPNANPDGSYRSGNHTIYGATRYNANSVDINRNFPDPDGGDHPDGKSWQPETIAMMDFAAQHNFVISANFHGGIEVVNYPWDTWYKRHTDDNWFIDISRDYADSAQFYSPSGYMDARNNGITNGFDWYEVEGGRQDYMNYWHSCREITIELSNTKFLAASLLPAYWDYNKVALLKYLENALFGIRGIVTDINTSLPIDALITVVNHDIDNTEVRTDPTVGDYHRMLSAGSYDLMITATGYVTYFVNSVSVSDFSTEIINIQMTPGIDNDNDGINDLTDNCLNLFNPDQTDTDSDNYGDLCDNCINISNPSQLDSDADNIGNLCDNCPETINPDQFDSDLDTYGDLCDNCPDIYNPDQADYDDNNAGDLCDYVCGDADFSKTFDVDDLVYMVNFAFKSGAEPYLMIAADVDNNGGVDIDDLIYMVNYAFNNGPEPVCD